ncbi:hypothetical protein G4V62_15230, partial [Bacillaceae bacterium SIJ1]|uniref:hypothetical protein n=1 Tax=Litoribacterium kuwaitense TaxID=1398745 RepID=UPI0013EDDD21
KKVEDTLSHNDRSARSLPIDQRHFVGTHRLDDSINYTAEIENHSAQTVKFQTPHASTSFTSGSFGSEENAQQNLQTIAAALGYNADVNLGNETSEMVDSLLGSIPPHSKTIIHGGKGYVEVIGDMVTYDRGGKVLSTERVAGKYTFRESYTKTTYDL